MNGMNVSGKRVLIFGDSLSHPGNDSGPETSEVQAGQLGPPGVQLAAKLLAAGARAARVDARVGRSALNFWSRENTAKLLGADVAWEPDLVFVMLGTNGGAEIKDAEALTKIHHVFASTGTEVWGIGPPALPEDSTAVVAMMRRVFGPKLIDARPLTPTGLGLRTGDGVHFTAAGAKIFAEGLARAVLTAGKSPVVMVLRAGFGLAAFAGLVGLAWIIGRRQRAPQS